MRTTLKIDDDVLAAAKAMAAREKRSLGSVISELARLALTKPVDVTIRNGFPVLPRRGGALATLELVKALEDELP